MAKYCLSSVGENIYLVTETTTHYFSFNFQEWAITEHGRKLNPINILSDYDKPAFTRCFRKNKPAIKKILEDI